MADAARHSGRGTEIAVSRRLIRPVERHLDLARVLYYTFPLSVLDFKRPLSERTAPARESLFMKATSQTATPESVVRLSASVDWPADTRRLKTLKISRWIPDARAGNVICNTHQSANAEALLSGNR